MTFVIALHDGEPPVTYWSSKPVNHPAGQWGEKKDALLFAKDSDAQKYINEKLATQAELCKVVPF